MAELEEIVQRVSVEGVGEVGATAIEMAHGFEDAFEKISKAAASGASGLELFGKGVVGIVVAAVAATAGLAALGNEGVKTIVEMQALGETLGTTAAGVMGLDKAFAKFGVGAEQADNALARMAVNVATSLAEIHRLQRTAGTDAESASEGIVSAELRVQEAKNKTAEVSQDASLKLRSDIVSVSEAYQTLEFAAADSASKMANAFLSVQSAALSVKSAVAQLADAMASTSVQAANLGANSADITAAEARQRVVDLESGHVDKAAQKDLQLRRARATRDQAELGKKDADYKKGTAGRDYDLKVEAAQLNLKKAGQTLSDAGLALQHAAVMQMSAASPQEKAQLGYDKAAFSQSKDISEYGGGVNSLAAQRAANDLASALTHVKEATEKSYDTLLKNPSEIMKALMGDPSAKIKNLGDVTLRNQGLAIEGEAEKKLGHAPKALEMGSELKKVFDAGQMTEAQFTALVGQMARLRQASQGTSEIAKTIRTTDLGDAAREGEKNPRNPQAEEVAAATEARRKIAEAGVETKAAGLKVVARNAEGLGKGADFAKATAEAINDAVVPLRKLGSGAEGTTDALARLQHAFDTFHMPAAPDGGGPPIKHDDSRLEGRRYAGGGEIYGPGSTTSDSIFARLSRGEFVTRAAAVQKYGSEFFHRVNDMTFPGFAMGGLVSSAMHLPGGIAPATSTVNLSIDGRTFGSLRGSKSTVDDLSSFAIARQTSAAGSNPSWMK